MNTLLDSSIATDDSKSGMKLARDEKKTVTSASRQERKELLERGFIPTNDAVTRLRCCRATFVETASKLCILPRKDCMGYNWFSEEEVTRIAREFARPKGMKLPRSRRVELKLSESEPLNISKEVFELFSQGKTPRDVVMTIRVHPTVVEHLWIKWGTMEGGFFVPGKDAKVVNGLPWSDAGSIDSWPELLDALRKEFALKKEEAKCRRCRQRPAKACETCLKQEIKKVEDAYMGIK